MALAAAVLGTAGAWLARGTWLPPIGGALVGGQPPEKAEVAVVLAGDPHGRRLMRAVELARQGWVKRVLVSGPMALYGVNEADLAIQFAVRQGVKRELLEPLPIVARSTMAEAQAVDRKLRERGVKRALIVTSNYHTRRARAIFDYYGSPGIRYLVAEAPDEYFRPQDWWRSREARSVVYLEYSKFLNWWVER